MNMPKLGAERTRAWRERKRTSEVTVQNVKKRKNKSEIERDSIERSRIRASLDGVNNKDHLLLHLLVIIYNILISL
jgi:hypothetical protein